MSAIISDCGRYRYRLERDLGLPDHPMVAWIMVNPSTADARQDDATIRKVIGFSARNGFGRAIVGNIFAYRATDIVDLAALRMADAVGPENDLHLTDIIAEADKVVVAWGANGKLAPQLRYGWKSVDAILTGLGKEALCLGVCADGHPRHPLMVGYDVPLQRWTAPR